MDQRLKRHESTTSIIERLNPTNKDPNDKQVAQVSLQYSTTNLADQPLEKTTLAHDHDEFVLHAPPPRPSYNILSYQELAAQAISPNHSHQYLQQCEVADIEAHENSTNMSECNSQYIGTLTSPSVEVHGHGYCRSSLCHNGENLSQDCADNLSDDSSSVIFSAKIKREPDNHSLRQQRNCVTLNFGPSSSLASSNEVIYFDYPPKNDKTLCEEEITEHNFHIDPSHFNPL